MFFNGIKKVALTKGLPGSGKSTWAKNFATNGIKRISKDDLRAMLDNSVYSKGNEKFIIQVRDAMILLALENGNHVVIDDTNLSPKHEEHIRNLVKGKAEVVIQDFTDVPLEVCIERDLKRFNSVGEKVIRKMHRQFIDKCQGVKYTENRDLPKAIIVDIDGTLAKMVNRSPYEWNKVKQDACNETIKNIVNTYVGKVIVVSGRDGVCLKETKEWLIENGIQNDKLFMRPNGNNEKDCVVKRRIFEEHIKGKYFIEYVLDDRNQVVEMWRSIGLTCLQVAEGDF